MRFHHKNHLFCSYLSLRNIADQVTAAATRGLSPSGTGPAGAPLPEDEWRKVQGPLNEALDALEAVVNELAGSLARDHERSAGLSATRAWVAVLLGQALEVIEDLEPARFSRKFGELNAAASRRLAAVAAQAKQLVRTARAQLGEGAGAKR
jgi:hypothetical protein